MAPTPQQENNQRIYDSVQKELKEVDKRIHRLEEAMEELKALTQPQATKKLSKGNGPHDSSKQPLSLKITADMPRFESNSDPREFLDKVKHLVTAYIGRESFEKYCDRYLSYLTVSEFHRQLLEEEFNQRTEPLTWDACETIFLRIALNEQERIAQVKALLETGRKDNESFRQFAMRIARDIRIYGVKDDNEMVLTLLGATVSDDLLNQMVTRLQARKPDAVTFTSISDFTKTLSGFVGPNSARDKSSGGPIRKGQEKPRFSPIDKKAHENADNRNNGPSFY
ncbi:hypothetical protein BGZ80_008216, partial [Entomortierella chlamydospora]